LYKGIYSVTLNHHVDFFFVPAFDRETDSSFQIPENADSIETEKDARCLVAGLSSYCITPNDNSAIQSATVVIRPPLPELSPHQVTLFFVSSDLFTVFSQELTVGSSTAGELHSSELVQTFLHSHFLQFLLNKVIMTDSFQVLHRQLLGMK